MPGTYEGLSETWLLVLLILLSQSPHGYLTQPL